MEKDCDHAWMLERQFISYRCMKCPAEITFETWIFKEDYLPNFYFKDFYRLKEILGNDTLTKEYNKWQQTLAQ